MKNFRKVEIWGHKVLLQFGPFHKVYMSSQLKSCEKFLCCDSDSDDPNSSQICTCHDSWAVVTCAKLWTDLIIICQVRAAWICKIFELWAHKLLLRWSPGSGWSVWLGLLKPFSQPLGWLSPLRAYDIFIAVRTGTIDIGRWPIR